MKRNAIWTLIGLVIAVNVGLLNAGEVKQVRSFETYNAGIILSTDPAGITYHNGHLFIADSEIDEIDAIWNCENIFEINLAGDHVFSTYDSYINGGLSCEELQNAVDENGNPLTEEQKVARRKHDREPTGITYNEYNGLFYITNDDRTRIMRYNGGFGEGFAQMFVQGADLEDITSDPSTGYLYAVVGVEGTNGDGISKVLVYSSDLDSLTEFSVDDRVTDPEGIAFDKRSNHLFLVSQADLKIFEYTLNGQFVDTYDISHLSPTPIDPQGLTFAPSSDPNDDPDNFSIYIVDGQLDNGPYPDERDGIVYEVEVLPIDFLANKKFKAEKYGDSRGNVHSNDKIEIKKGLPSTFTGNLTAVNDIKIEDKNTINGNVAAGGNLDIKSGATINGTTSAYAAVAAREMPSVSFSAGGNDIKLKKNETQSLAPGSYGKVEADKNSILKLSSGEYFFKKLDMKDEATLFADITEGEIIINVVEEVKFHKKAKVDVADSRDFTLRQAKDKEIKFDEDSRFWGSIIAPSGKVKLEKNAEFKGSIVAEEIEVKDHATLNTHSGSLAPTKMSAPKLIAGNTETPTSGQGTNSVPSGYSLSQNYPNPFNPQTQINFQLPAATHVVLRIYNVRGQEVLRLLDRTYSAGTHTVRWDGKDNFGNRVPSGIYFYRFQAGEFLQVKKMTLLK